jgi:hypothetical protein
MTEAQLYERVGRQQVLIENQDAAYTALLRLLAQVVKGEVTRDRVMVNLTARAWTVAPDGFRPETPATINGLPECVVAPAEPPPADQHAAE